MTAAENMTWQTVCNLDDITVNAGVCAKIAGQQVAIFRIKTDPGAEGSTLFAIGNHDPFSNANVMSRGITGSIGEKTVVASPVYKQHFDLVTGQCIEDETVSIPTYGVRLDGNVVQIQA